MKIKIPFVNKKIILDPIYEGLFMLLGIYALFSLVVMSMAAFGAKNMLIIAATLILFHMIKTSKIDKEE